MTYEQIPNMPRAQVAERLGCFTREIARRLNQQLPWKGDPFTTLDSVSAEGTTLTYHYTVDLARAQLPPAMLEALKARVRTTVCGEEEMRTTIGIGGAYRYLWNDREGGRIDELLVASCPAKAEASPQAVI
jgi:hypothetical protein